MNNPFPLKFNTPKPSFIEIYTCLGPCRASPKLPLKKTQNGWYKPSIHMGGVLLALLTLDPLQCGTPSDKWVFKPII